MKIILCCSKHFYHIIPKIKQKLEKQGHKVMLPNSYENPMKEEKLKRLSKEEHIKWKTKMMKLHQTKIKQNDAILVLNFKKGNYENYIGGATFMEIVKAWELKKKIFMMNKPPKCSFTDEITGINPIILNQDLSLIK